MTDDKTVGTALRGNSMSESKLFLVFLLTLCAVFSAYGQIINRQGIPRLPDATDANSQVTQHSQTKKQDISKLLEVMDAKSQATQMFDIMLPDMQKALPGVPAEFWSKFKTGIKRAKFVEMLVPIYDKHFSHEDIKNLIEFYESPMGKKLVKVTPLLNKDSYQVGAKWGEELAKDITVELKKQGYL